MFFARFQRLSLARPGNDGIVFEFTAQNKASRKATIQSEEYELWMSKARNSPEVKFLDRLSLDLSSSLQSDAGIGPQELRSVNLTWHYTAPQLQRIEDWRRGTEPAFQIRSRLGVLSQWVNPDATPHGSAVFRWESVSDEATSVYPLTVTIRFDDWIQLLNDIGFKHIMLQELSIPILPPGFARADEHLKSAWDSHREGKDESALHFCFKAFECLGYNLYQDKVEKKVLLSRLMDGEKQPKIEKIEALWDALREFSHLARHERGEPVDISHKDAELALVSATALLKYLGDLSPQ